jgi:hypothetical protein
MIEALARPAAYYLAGILSAVAAYAAGRAVAGWRERRERDAQIAEEWRKRAALAQRGPVAGEMRGDGR